MKDVYAECFSCTDKINKSIIVEYKSGNETSDTLEIENVNTKNGQNVCYRIVVENMFF